MGEKKYGWGMGKVGCLLLAELSAFFIKLPDSGVYRSTLCLNRERELNQRGSVLRGHYCFIGL